MKKGKKAASPKKKEAPAKTGAAKKGSAAQEEEEGISDSFSFNESDLKSHTVKFQLIPPNKLNNPGN
jgi:hypothetical protein